MGFSSLMVDPATDPGLEASPALPDLSWHDVRIVRNVSTALSKCSWTNKRPRYLLESITLSRVDKLDWFLR